MGGTNASEAQLAELRRIPQDLHPPRSGRPRGARPPRRGLGPSTRAARICPADYGAEAVRTSPTYFARYGRREDLRAPEPARRGEHRHPRRRDGGRQGDRRPSRTARLHAAKNIAPLLAPLEPEGLPRRDGRHRRRDDQAQEDLDQHGDQRRTRGASLARGSEAAGREPEAEMKRRKEEYRQRVAEAQPEIDELFAPGVLVEAAGTPPPGCTRSTATASRWSSPSWWPSGPSSSRCRTAGRSGPRILLTATAGQGEEPHRRRRRHAPAGGVLLRLRDRQRAEPILQGRGGSRVPEAHVRLPERDRRCRGPLGIPEADALEGVGQRRSSPPRTPTAT